MPEVLTTIEAMQALAKALAKPCMYIGNLSEWPDVEGPDEEFKAAPYLDYDKHGQAILDGSAILVFDTYDEMRFHYEMTVGDDGPTERNSYNGPMRIYALTCNAEGVLENENT